MKRYSLFLGVILTNLILFPMDLSAARTPSADAQAAEPKSSKIPKDILKLRDPFKRMTVANPKAVPGSDLEVIPIENLKLIGILTGRGLDKMRAMIQGPNGKTYFVTENMKIGTKRGFIRKITPKGLTIRERTTNVLGEDENVDTELKIISDEKKIGLNW